MKVVCNGASLQCSLGSTPSILNVDPKSVQVENTSICTESDAKPYKNIQTFGICSLTGLPCTPITSSWTNASKIVMAGNESVVLESSTVICSIGGLITVTSAGQESVYAR